MKNYERLIPQSDLLRTFLSVAENENVTRAGEALGRTQSAVSVQIRRLEDALCVTLFERQARGMVLTSEGQKLLPAAHRVITELQEIGTLFETRLSGRIRVGLPDDYSDTVLEHTLVEFAKSHSGVEIITQSGCSSGFPELVRRNELDVAVWSGPDPTTGDIVSSEGNSWVLSKTLDLDSDAPVPLAVLDRNCWWSDLPQGALSRVCRKWKVVYSSPSFASLKTAVAAGLAVSVLPTSAVTPSMRQLTKKDGFPRLPDSKRSIIIAEQAPEDLALAMAAALRKAIGQIQSGGRRRHRS